MCNGSTGTSRHGRARYTLRPRPKTARLLRLRETAGTDDVNPAGVRFPARGRRAWLDRLAAERYRTDRIGWKAFKR